MIEPPTIHIGLLVLDFHIPAARSLKDKRRVIKSLKERLRSRFNAAVAEVAEQNKWQRAVCAVTTVASDKRRLEQLLSSIRTFAETQPEAALLDCQIEIL